jgi:diketogulonate reductase-like aldo/keto reductase
VNTYFESDVGDALAETHIPRADLFIQTKFVSLPHHKPFAPPYPPYEANKANDACQISLFRSLENLKTTYVDAFFINAPDLTVTPMTALLTVLKNAKTQRLARYTGLCNVPTVQVLEYLHSRAPEVIQIVQNPFHSPWDPEYRIHDYCRANGIQYNTFHTLTTSDRIINDHRMQSMAKQRGMSPAINLLQYCVQSDITPLIGARSEQNLRSVMPIATGEIEALSKDQLRTFSRLMAEQTVINRYRSVTLLRRRERQLKKQQGREKMTEDQKAQLLESIAERERKEQEIVESAKVRAKAMADRLRAEAAVAQAEEEKKRAVALDLLSRTVAGKIGEAPREEKISVNEDTLKEEQAIDADEDEDGSQPTLKGRQRRTRK